jgi:hypothetical protein
MDEGDIRCPAVTDRPALREALIIRSAVRTRHLFSSLVMGGLPDRHRTVPRKLSKLKA